MNLQELVTRNREKIYAAASRYGASNVRLFGSVSRGDFRADSDVDLLVDLAPGRSLLDLCGLGIALEDMLHRKVDVFTESGLKPRVLVRALQEAKPL